MAEQEAANGKTRVEIYDQVYHLSGEGDGAYVRQLAARVDAKMRHVARQNRVVDSLRVAVLTAVNLADENERLRRKYAQLEETLSEKTASYRQKLDRALSRVG